MQLYILLSSTIIVWMVINEKSFCYHIVPLFGFFLGICELSSLISPPQTNFLPPPLVRATLSTWSTLCTFCLQLDRLRALISKLMIWERPDITNIAHCSSKWTVCSLISHFLQSSKLFYHNIYGLFSWITPHIILVSNSEPYCALPHSLTVHVQWWVL